MRNKLKVASIAMTLLVSMCLSAGSHAGWGNWGPKLLWSNSGGVTCSNGSHRAMLEWFGVVRGGFFGAWTETTNISNDIILVEVLTQSGAIPQSSNWAMRNQRVIVSGDTHDVNVISGSLGQLTWPFDTYTRCRIFR